MIPSVQNSKTDGNLSAVSDTDRILAIIAPASSGTFNVAGAYTNKSDVVAAFTSGPLVEDASYLLNLGVPVVLIRGNPTTAGSFGSIDSTGITGTATVAAAGGSHPDNTYDVIVKITTGGILGTTGILFIYSLDNGNSFSAPQSLGTSLTMTLERGISFTLSTTSSTLLAGDTFKVATVEPLLTTTDLATSLTALTAYHGEWLRALIHTNADATILGQLDLFAKSFHGDGKYPEMIANTRPRALTGEDRPTYQTALAVIAGGVQSDEVSCCADQCEIVSLLDGRRLRMPPSLPFVARLMLNDDSQDAAAKADGALPGVFLTDINGNTVYHDERRYPGLDDLGFTTLRSWGGRPISPGAYVNNPRLLSGASSDYKFFQLSAILNRIIEDSFTLLQPKLSMSVLCDTTTGKIREDVAQSIDDAMNGELRTRYVDSKRCSGLLFKLSRTDDVLGTSTIHFDIKIVPLAYIKKFIGKTGLVRTLPA